MENQQSQFSAMDHPCWALSQAGRGQNGALPAVKGGREADPGGLKHSRGGSQEWTSGIRTKALTILAPYMMKWGDGSIQGVLHVQSEN